MGSDEPGVAEELDEDMVDEDVLGDGLDHHHPLLTEHAQNRRDIQDLRHKGRHVALESGGHIWAHLSSKIHKN